MKKTLANVSYVLGPVLARNSASESVTGEKFVRTRYGKKLPKPKGQVHCALCREFDRPGESLIYKERKVSRSVNDERQCN